jgi:hypothetical protein
MKKFKLIAGKPAAAIAVALLAAASLAACGSGTQTQSYPDPGTPAPMIDAFFAAVSGIVSASSDTAEGNTIEALTATLPENTEPEPLG